MKIAKELTGGIHVSVTNLLSASERDKVKSKNVRVDLDEISNRVPQVRESSVRNILPIIKGFAAKLSRPIVRESLLAMGLPPNIVDAALLKVHFIVDSFSFDHG